MADITLPPVGALNWGPPLSTAISAVNEDVEQRARDAQVVKLTGAQSVSGVKTFTNGIILPPGTLDPSAIDGFASAIATAVDAYLILNPPSGSSSWTEDPDNPGFLMEDA